MSGNKNALKPPEKEMTTEDDRGRRLWDRGEYQKVAQNRLKVYGIILVKRKPNLGL